MKWLPLFNPSAWRIDESGRYVIFQIVDEKGQPIAYSVKELKYHGIYASLREARGVARLAKRQVDNQQRQREASS
jgi:hypothetical protein